MLIGERLIQGQSLSSSPSFSVSVLRLLSELQELSASSSSVISAPQTSLRLVLDFSSPLPADSSGEALNPLGEWLTSRF